MHTITLKLKPNIYQKRIADKRFRLMWKVHNQLAKHANHRINALRHDKEYRQLLTAYHEAKNLGDEAKTKILSDELYAKRNEHGLTKGEMYAYASKMQKDHKQHLSSHQVQKETDRILSAIEDVLYGDGKRINFKKLRDFNNISSLSMNGCHYIDPLHPSRYKRDKIEHPEGQIVWLGETIKVDIDWSDQYTSFSLDHPLSYCEIERKPFKNGWHYYVILYLDGPAPVKTLPGKGTSSIDPGVSTMCVLSDEKLHFEELAPKCKEYDKEITKTQTKIERSKRLGNPGNYNKDGTVKKGKHEWKISNNCRKLKWQLSTAYRQKTEYTKHEHNRLSNKLMHESNRFISEAMNYQALAKRSKKEAERQDKETEIVSKNGEHKTVRKFKKKRRFGKSISNRSPGLFLRILKKKVERFGGTFEYADTIKLKASQYCHDTDSYVKVPLSQRKKVIDNHIVYRDPYSAFVIRYSNDKHDAPDRVACIRMFPDFLKKQEAMIEEVTKNQPGRPACFGF